MYRIVFDVLLLLFFFFSCCSCGDMISAIVDDPDGKCTTNGKMVATQANNINIPKNFKQGNKRWFKAKKDLMKFTPQSGIELGKKVARNVSIGVIWIYEPGLLLAEELVAPCFGIISYYPNVQITVMKGERFLGIICDARDHKPINTDRFKWYVAIGDGLTFTARHYVKEGAYIKEGQELGHLSRPAKSVGRVAIKSRARCSGIIVLCKTGIVNTGEEFLRISCDAAPGTADVNNSLVDQSHTSLLDQSELGKSIPKLRGLAHISTAEAKYDNENFQLPQIVDSADNGFEDQKTGKEEPKVTKETQYVQSNENPQASSDIFDKTISSSDSEPNASNKLPHTPPGSKKNKNFFDFALDEEEDDGADDRTESSILVDDDGPKEKNDKEIVTEPLEKFDKERLEKERLEKERLEKERLEKERLEKERLEKERLEKERLEKEKLERERLEKMNNCVQAAKSVSNAEDSKKIIHGHKGINTLKNDKLLKNEIMAVERGHSAKLEGLSSSLVSEAEISVLD